MSNLVIEHLESILESSAVKSERARAYIMGGISYIIQQDNRILNQDLKIKKQSNELDELRGII